MDFDYILYIVNEMLIKSNTGLFRSPFKHSLEEKYMKYKWISKNILSISSIAVLILLKKVPAAALIGKFLLKRIG